MGHTQGETIEQVWCLLLRAVLPLFYLSAVIHKHTHTYAYTWMHTHTHTRIDHSTTLLIFKVYLRDGHWNFYHSRRTVICGLCAPPAEGGGSGIAQAPAWRKLELKSRRGVFGKFTQVCVWEREGVLPDTSAGQQVTQRWEGIADIPENFPIKIQYLPLWWKLCDDMCLCLRDDNLIRFSSSGSLSGADKWVKELLIFPSDLRGSTVRLQLLIYLYCFSDERTQHLELFGERTKVWVYVYIIGKRTVR